MDWYWLHAHFITIRKIHKKQQPHWTPTFIFPHKKKQRQQPTTAVKFHIVDTFSLFLFHCPWHVVLYSGHCAVHWNYKKVCIFSLSPFSTPLPLCLSRCCTIEVSLNCECFQLKCAWNSFKYLMQKCRCFSLQLNGEYIFILSPLDANYHK